MFLLCSMMWQVMHIQWNIWVTHNSFYKVLGLIHTHYSWIQVLTNIKNIEPYLQMLHCSILSLSLSLSYALVTKPPQHSPPHTSKPFHLNHHNITHTHTTNLNSNYNDPTRLYHTTHYSFIPYLTNRHTSPLTKPLTRPPTLAYIFPTILFTGSGNKRDIFFNVFLLSLSQYPSNVCA